jgi:hypothetical protein
MTLLTLLGSGISGGITPPDPASHSLPTVALIDAVTLTVTFS